MKSFLFLGFYFYFLLFTIPAFVSGGILNENASLPRSTATGAQKQLPKVLLLRPQAKKGQKIERILYLKQLLELKCLEKILNDVRNKNRSRYPKPYRIIRPSAIPSFKNLQDQVLHSYNNRHNALRFDPRSRTNFGNNRIIFLPPKAKFSEKQTNKFQQNKTSQSNSREATSSQKSENSNEKKQTAKLNQAPPSADNSPKIEEKSSKENSRVFIHDDDMPKAVTYGSYPKIIQKLNEVKLTPFIYPAEAQNFQQHTRPVRPYDVTESIRELIIDLFDEKNNDDFRNHQYDEQTYLESSVLRQGHAQKTDNVKSYATNPDINNSVNTVLKTLIESMNSSTKKSKHIIYNSPFHNGYPATNLKNFNNSDRFSNSNMKTTERKFSINRQQQTKHLKITSPYFNEILKPTKTTAGSEAHLTDFTSILKGKNMKSGITKNITNTPSAFVKIEKWSDPVEISQQTMSSEYYDNVKEFSEQNALLKKPKPDTQTSFPFSASQTSIGDSTIIQKQRVADNENSSNFSITLSEKHTTPTEQTTKTFISKKFTNADSRGKTTENPETKEDTKLKTDFPEAGLTMPIFTEFTDHPLTIDLLTTIKKDQELVWKNSRKMHFDQEIPTTTTFNRASNPEQRRSDILIDENSDDYILDDSFSALSYLKRLRQNNSLNSTSDYIIQLIPFVINDLRENKISPEDIFILSKTFGKYWTAVLALTNNTDLDMLPLLKMKNEKDLNNILHTFFPENSYLITTEMKKTDHDNYVGYDYEDVYKDLNEDLRRELGKEETSRFKRDVQDLRYFESLKKKQNLVYKYKYKA